MLSHFSRIWSHDHERNQYCILTWFAYYQKQSKHCAFYPIRYSISSSLVTLMYFTLPLLGKQSHRISYSRKRIMENLNTELISRFGECPLSPCDTPGMCHPPSRNEGRPTHFLALRLQSPSLIRNVSISSWMICRHNRYRKRWLKWIRITPRL